MSSSPSFVLGYWRPWKQDVSLVDSYCGYLRDISLIRFGTDAIKDYLSSQNQVIRDAASDIGMHLDKVGDILIKQLEPLNRNLDIAVQQQRLTNLLLEDIAELLRIPDSEKERQMKISLGIKYFIQAQKDSDLYDESLRCFLEAEKMRPLDHFVLYRIGYIYLYSPNNVNVENAIDYFSRAAKLAIIEDDPETIELASIMTMDKKSEYHAATHDLSSIRRLAADSLNKGAYGLYILGRDQEAITMQKKAVDYSGAGKDYFFLAKYEARANEIHNCCVDLDIAMDEDPITAEAALLDPDLASREEVLEVVKKKSRHADSTLDALIADEPSEFLRTNYEWAKSNLSLSEKLELLLNA